MSTVKQHVKATAPFLVSPYQHARAAALRPIERVKAWQVRRGGYADIEDLISRHYETWVEYDYQLTREGFRRLLRLLGERPATVVETGTSAWGVDSTRLFDEYVRTYGGRFWSVDLRPEPSKRLRSAMGSSTELVVGDSVDFLQSLAMLTPPHSVNAFYLDSYDLDWEDPTGSELHGLHEWNALQAAAAPGCLVLIDDTPAEVSDIPIERPEARRAAERLLAQRGFLPGKGALVLQAAKSNPAIEVLWHKYNVLLRIGDSSAALPDS